jgi:HupE / UreJ protein
MTMMKRGGLRLRSVFAKIVSLSLLLSASCAALAHDVPPSTAMLDIGRRVIDIELQLPLSDLGAALELPLVWNPKAVIPQYGSRIEDYIRDKLRVHDRDGRAYPLRIESLDMRHTDNANWISNDWLIVRAALEAPSWASTEVFTLDYSVILERVVSHNALIYVRRDIRNGLLGDKPVPIGLMGFGHTHLDIDGSSGSWWRGFAHLFSLGMQHIAEGTDHLLFLLVLLLPAPLIASAGRWHAGKSTAASVWTIVKIVSGFTLAHSLTLALASVGWFSVPSRPIEVLIAVSIIVSGIHAWRPLFAGREIWIAFSFGLVHGLAFASVLAGLSFDGWTLVLSLLGFNLGIEAMQLLVIAAVLPPLILLSARRGFAAFRIAGATFAALCSLGWIAERGFQVANPLEPLLRWLAAPPMALVVSLCLASVVSMSLLVRTSRITVGIPRR